MDEIRSEGLDKKINYEQIDVFFTKVTVSYAFIMLISATVYILIKYTIGTSELFEITSFVVLVLFMVCSAFIIIAYFSCVGVIFVSSILETKSQKIEKE